MSLLALQNVSKRYREGQCEQIVLKEVSLELGEGELAAIYGTRRSGRTTLLRTAAGIQAPDCGRVLFEGRDLSHSAEDVLGIGIGYVHRSLRAGEEQGVLEQIAAPLLARGVAVADARSRARRALQRTGAERCAERAVSELGSGERVRVALARALCLSPALLIVDEPMATVELAERDEILALLRSLAGDGLAVLFATGDPTELAGAHRALTLSDGQLRGPSVAALAPVVALRARSV